MWHAEWKAHSQDPLWGQARCSWGSTRLKRATRWSEWGQYCWALCSLILVDQNVNESEGVIKDPLERLMNRSR